MVSENSVRTAAKRRSGTIRELVAPSRVVIMDLRGLRRMGELEARRRTCGHVAILLSHRGVRWWRRVLRVRRGVNSQYACLQVCGSVTWVALSRSEAKRVSS
jgi:hypothetical protein